MNSFGMVFRVSVFGESHGPAVGVTIDGCPPGIEIKPEDFIRALQRRQGGSKGTTARRESDIPEILSGVFNGCSTGAPLTIITRNKDADPSAYSDFTDIPRPGHADFTARKKFSGFSDYRGSGHFSGRITWGLVVAGVIARHICGKCEINAGIISAGGSDDVEDTVNKALAINDSIGGIIECVVINPPVAIGEPFFHSFESVLSHLVFSIPAVKGIEFGSGFASAAMKGSEHNDPVMNEKGETATNNAGGINGGITNGNNIIFRVAVKPASSIGVAQETYNFRTGQMQTLRIEGRHDTCIALRMPVIIEAVTAIAMADLMMIDRGIFGERKR